jgi:hypothetical protein
MMRCFSYVWYVWCVRLVWLAAVVAAGCGETAVPTLPSDAGRDAAIDRDGGADGGADGGDGSVDDGGTDASIPDGGPDGGDPDGGGPWCNTSPLCPACPDMDALCDEDNPCATGEACLTTGCDDLSRCFVIGGGACGDNDDCGNPAYACNQSIGRCLRAEPGCDDSNDCVAGFACESNTCVDRRVPCDRGADCPHGFTCFFASPDQRFCRRITRPCNDDLDCLVLGVPCGDADGDGRKECMPSLMPNTPDAVSCDKTQCTEEPAPVCESEVQGTGATCGRFGPCLTADDCVQGFVCRDLWGDGRAECVLSVGSCVDSSDCGTRNVCASPRPSGSPACVAGATR